MVENDYINCKNISKKFGEVKALDDINFVVRKGEIHGLLGENGAGKSTLMNILYGLYSPDEGEIIIGGEKTNIKSPLDSIKIGIGMVHQVSTLVPDFTAVENIILGSEGEKFTLPISREREDIIKISEEFGLQFPADVKIKELSAGVKQKIEIVRALYGGATLLILDEPTTSLVESEFQQLLKSLKVFVDKGVTVVFITHKIKEVMEACTAVTVLRKGKVQARVPKEELGVENLVKLMFMEQDIEVTESALPKVNLPEIELSEKPVAQVKNISIIGDDTSPGLKNISFDIFGGEILGVAAVSGNGEKSIAECIIHPTMLDSGEIFIDEKSMKNNSPVEVFANGVFYTPEDRIKEGILNEGSIKENILLGHHQEDRFLKKKIFIDWKEAASAARDVIKEFNVATPDEDLSIRRLSGGNIQKAILGRAFVSPLKLLVTHNPTSGLDISTVEFIFNKLVELRNKGGAVLFVNEDLDELMIVCDRIAVLHDGELKGIFKRSEFDKFKIGLLMIGG
ncbi:MAG: ABC transporter ATP-binding protein [Spirochaetia bacterium]|nr:ABC transporter ATP-binding protein [Spirochaetia bacterium]